MFVVVFPLFSFSFLVCIWEDVTIYVLRKWGQQAFLLVQFFYLLASYLLPILTALARFAFGHNKHLKPIAAAYCKPQSNAVLSSLPSLAMKGTGSVYTPPQSMPHGILGPSQIGPLLRVGGDCQSAVRDGRVSTSSPLTASGIMHGSPPCDDLPQHSDPGMFSEDVSYGVASHTRPKPLDNALYSQCVFAMRTLAKDPSPCVASLGRRVLSFIGIEQVVTKSVKSTGSSARPGEPTTPSLAGLARSASWFDMNGGNHFTFFFFFLFIALHYQIIPFV